MHSRINTTLSLRLREQTAAAHRTLENRLAILHDDLTLADYDAILRSLYGYLAPWWPYVDNYLPPDMSDSIAGARHLRRLEFDIARRGIDRDSIPLINRAALPAIDNIASALGSCYVIEGSMLGARTIAPELQRRFGFDANCGAMYFSGDGHATGRRWANMRELLDTLVSPAGQACAIAAADATFRTLLRWFEIQRVTPAEPIADSARTAV